MTELVAQLGVGLRATPATAWAPPISVWETDKEIVTSFDLAGVSRESVEVAVIQGQLVVTGHRPAPWTNGNTEARLQTNECWFGPFRRTVPLRPEAQSEELIAKVVDGVLEVRMPRSTDPAVKRIIPVA